MGYCLAVSNHRKVLVPQYHWKDYIFHGSNMDLDQAKLERMAWELVWPFPGSQTLTTSINLGQQYPGLDGRQRGSDESQGRQQQSELNSAIATNVSASEKQARLFIKGLIEIHELEVIRLEVWPAKALLTAASYYRHHCHVRQRHTVPSPTSRRSPVLFINSRPASSSSTSVGATSSSHPGVGATFQRIRHC